MAVAVGGGSSPQTASTRRSVVTTWPAWSSRYASRARCFGPPNAWAPLPLPTSRWPSNRNSARGLSGAAQRSSASESEAAEPSTGIGRLPPPDVANRSRPDPGGARRPPHSAPSRRRMAHDLRPVRVPSPCRVAVAPVADDRVADLAPSAPVGPTATAPGPAGARVLGPILRRAHQSEPKRPTAPGCRPAARGFRPGSAWFRPGLRDAHRFDRARRIWARRTDGPGHGKTRPLIRHAQTRAGYRQRGRMAVRGRRSGSPAGSRSPRGWGPRSRTVAGWGPVTPGRRQGPGRMAGRGRVGRSQGPVAEAGYRRPGRIVGRGPGPDRGRGRGRLPPAGRWPAGPGAARSAVEDEPAELVAKALVVEDELSDGVGKLGALPLALAATSFVTLAFGRRRPRCLDGVGGGTELVGRDVGDHPGLTGGECRVSRSSGQLPGRGIGMAACRACLRSS